MKKTQRHEKWKYEGEGGIFRLPFFCVMAMSALALLLSGASIPTNRLTICNMDKGDEFQTADGALVEEHLAEKERLRYKVKVGGENGSGFYGLKKSDWTGFNSIVFNCYYSGDKPWKGVVMIGDKASYEKWTMNYVEIPLTLKPGENKEVHVNIRGLFAANSKRTLVKDNIQCLFFYGGKKDKEFYFSNIYLSKE